MDAWNEAEHLTVKVAQHTGDPYFPNFTLTTRAVQAHLNGGEASLKACFDRLLRTECAVSGRPLIDLDNLDIDVEIKSAEHLDEDPATLVFEDMLLFRSKRVS